MAESPLIKLWKAWADAIEGRDQLAEDLAGLAVAIREAEVRWELERELHLSQVKKIRKQRHEYIEWLRGEVVRLGGDPDARQ